MAYGLAEIPVQAPILTKLMPFNGINDHSIVVQDNCSIHHVPEIQKLVEDTGIIMMYLPPYLPDYNPIEEAFAKVTSTLKAFGTHR